jgi:phosphate starvation-inducible PhoH-like protein
LNTKEIKLSDFDSTAVFGPNNVHLKTLQVNFPNLKIIARGELISLTGDEFEISLFEEKLNEMLRIVSKFGTINDAQVEAILRGEFSSPLTLQEETKQQTADIILYGNNGKVIRAKTPNQLKMVKALEKNDVLFAIGPAGTGKTYTAVALAVKALKAKEIKRIILARPAVEAGENLGFLPGDLKEKIDPYLRPLYDALDDMIPADKLKNYIETRVIEIAPMAFMRGRTLDNAYVILDEAQNATDLQLKMFLTRMGPSAKFIITGDLTQIDLPKQSLSGLLKAVQILKNIKGIEFAYLNFEDVVRHKLVKDIIKAYEGKPKDNKENNS